MIFSDVGLSAWLCGGSTQIQIKMKTLHCFVFVKCFIFLRDQNKNKRFSVLVKKWMNQVVFFADGIGVPKSEATKGKKGKKATMDRAIM